MIANKGNMDELEMLCADHKKLSEEIDELTEKKNALREEILNRMTDSKMETEHFKILKVSMLQVKTPLESARALNCVVVKEEVDKDALKKLHREGVPVEGIAVTTSLRITSKLKEALE